MKGIPRAEKRNKIMRFAKRNTNSNMFSISDNMLMCAQKVAVPSILQKQMLKKFHIGHWGISRLKSR